MDEQPVQLPPSFSRLVLGRALTDTVRFLGYRTRDTVLGAVALLIGIGCAYTFVGKADTMSELALIGAFTFAPAGIILFGVFIWHLWLAPAALAYEAMRSTSYPVVPPSPQPPARPAINWAIWKQRQKYSIAEFAAILAKCDPTTEIDTPERAGFRTLLTEQVGSRNLSVSRSQRADGYETPDLWPGLFDIQRNAALAWAKSKGFEISHIE